MYMELKHKIRMYNILQSLPPTSDPGLEKVALSIHAKDPELTNKINTLPYNNIPEPLMINEVAQKLVVVLVDKQQIMSQDPRDLIYT